MVYFIYTLLTAQVLKYSQEEHKVRNWSRRWVQWSRFLAFLQNLYTYRNMKIPWNKCQCQRRGTLNSGQSQSQTGWESTSRIRLPSSLREMFGKVSGLGKRRFKKGKEGKERKHPQCHVAPIPNCKSSWDSFPWLSCSDPPHSPDLTPALRQSQQFSKKPHIYLDSLQHQHVASNY